MQTCDLQHGTRGRKQAAWPQALEQEASQNHCILWLGVNIAHATTFIGMCSLRLHAPLAPGSFGILSGFSKYGADVCKGLQLADLSHQCGAL